MIDHIVVQAGGKGTRLGHLTANKPKALVPVENLPMLFHLFRRFPDKHFVVIADHHREVLHRYLAAFADVSYEIVDAEGTGTCGGIGQALERVPDGAPFLLVWSDLVLPEAFRLPTGPGNYVGISQTFECRWRFADGAFAEDKSTEHGVAGLFVFAEKSLLAGVPASGEFVRFLQGQASRDNLSFGELGLAGTREFGLLSEYEALAQEKTRPFNRITVTADRVVKEPLDAQGRQLAAREQAWYAFAAEHGVTAIPAVHELEPLTLERLRGGNIYDYPDLDRAAKRQLLRQLTDGLKQLHAVGSAPADPDSLRDAYFGKTMARLAKVRDLVPFADRETITVNGRECRNVFHHENDLERLLDKLDCPSFAFLHGDCTFSNLMLRDGAEPGAAQPVFIDPRGYFGTTELFGDPNYDWAKLYYSVVGNYDRFNLKDFRLTIGAADVELAIASNRWEELEADFFEFSGADRDTVKLLHAVIWLSLTTYAWQDYDSICGAFYNGLYHLEEVL